MQVVTSPSSSLVWVQYMAHHLAQGEISAARQTAERALRIINFRCAPAASLRAVLPHSELCTPPVSSKEHTYRHWVALSDAIA